MARYTRNAYGFVNVNNTSSSTTTRPGRLQETGAGVDDRRRVRPGPVVVVVVEGPSPVVDLRRQAQAQRQVEVSAARLYGVVLAVAATGGPYGPGRMLQGVRR